MAKAIAAYRRDHPYCERADCTRLMNAVDHVIPLAELPRDDPRRYDPSNFQSLCASHHSEKTAQDARRGRTRLRG